MSNKQKTAPQMNRAKTIYKMNSLVTYCSIKKTKTGATCESMLDYVNVKLSVSKKDVQQLKKM